nr:MAG TPA: hypothetical protein [Bacteriophage sp.]
MAPLRVTPLSRVRLSVTLPPVMFRVAPSAASVTAPAASVLLVVVPLKGFSSEWKENACHGC